MTKPLKVDRPFSEQPALAPVTSTPPVYGNEHEAARNEAIARSEYIEDVDKSNLVDPAARNTKKQRLRRHCMRYWICYLLANILLLAILLPILFLVIFPAIAQELVKKQELVLWEASLLQPAPDMMTFELLSTITVPKPFTVVLDPLNMSLFVRDSDEQAPYAFLQLPKNELHGNATIKVEPQRTRIVNQAQWLHFLNESVYSEALTLAAKGKTTGHFGKLKASLTLDKDIRIKGLNKLQGFEVASAQLLLPPDQAGNNLLSTLTIPNYSPVTFDLGNQTFNLMIGNLTAGEATIYDLTLVPGNNTKTLIGSLDFGVVIANIEYILNASSEAIAAGNLRLFTTGKSTIYQGQHIPYYEEILGGLTLQADIPITNLLIGTLGGYLNDTAGGLQNIINQVPLAVLNGQISVTSLQSALTTAYANGTGSIQDIGAAVGDIFTEAGQLDIGGLFTAFGAAVGAVNDGAATAGDIFTSVTAALGNTAATVGDIVNSFNLTALIPQPRPPPA